MPFKRGFEPIRSSLEYLSKCPIKFIDNVKILTVNYNVPQSHITVRGRKFELHEGAKDFVIWTLPRVQFHNPKMQILTFLNQTPTPFVTCYLKGSQGPYSRKMDNDLKEIHFDVEGQTKEEILERLQTTLGKSEEELEMLALKRDKWSRIRNPSHFGKHCERHCICGEYGQVPCPSFLPLPYKYRGKHFYKKPGDDD